MGGRKVEEDRLLLLPEEQQADALVRSLLPFSLREKVALREHVMPCLQTEGDGDAREA